MNDLIEVNCATCNEELEIFDDDTEFNCPYCGANNIIVGIEEVPEEITEEKWEVITDRLSVLEPNVSILTTWCRKHRRKTYQLWTGPRLRCLLCWPSYTPKGFKVAEVE